MILLFYSSKEVENGGGGHDDMHGDGCFLLGNGNDDARRRHSKVMKGVKQ